ncbi:hypothetical protein MMC26_000056 [Xylographa opegraphella]|nr:hypothetical protein [Xylographa opegraphella]
MFQSFTGNSRRPRQVNLSGRNTNPFAAVSNSKTLSNTQKSQDAIAHAQQERRARQQERERLHAVRTMQRTWRGHATRKEIKDRFRQEWDYRENFSESESAAKTDGYNSQSETITQLNLLLRFASPLNSLDIRRLQRFASRAVTDHERPIWSSTGSTGCEWRQLLARTSQLCIKVIQKSFKTSPLPEDIVHDLLVLLCGIAKAIPDHIANQYEDYYNTLSKLVRTAPPYSPPGGCSSSLLEAIIIAPLQDTKISQSYKAFADAFLTTPQLQQHLNLDNLATGVNINTLTTKLREVLTSDDGTQIITTKSKEDLLWLLSHFTYLWRAQPAKHTKKSSPNTDFIAVVSILLSGLAEEIISRQGTIQRSSPNPLPDFVANQISKLVDQESVTGLLNHSELLPANGMARNKTSQDAATLATYALTLLRVFPQRNDEIRMWLYLGSAQRSQGNGSEGVVQVQAIQYFWEAVVQTEVFRLISLHPENAVGLLKSDSSDQTRGRDTRSQDRYIQAQEWRVILLFLELYTFVLKVMDDEEFMNGAEPDQHRLPSARRGALKLTQVKDLTIFLKNLAFSMYWNAAKISGVVAPVTTPSLAGYFGNSSAVAPVNIDSAEALDRPKVAVIAGINGMTLSYMQGMVTGLLRMIYERDSRRKFLPVGHWLMTSHFDMKGFISKVVLEEENKHQNQETEEGVDDYLQSGVDEDNDLELLVGTNRTQQVRRIERMQSQQRKIAKRKQAEALAPRLSILQHVPFFIPFTTRVEIFHEFVILDQAKRRGGIVDADLWRMLVSNTRGPDDLGKHRAIIRREHCFEDAYKQFYQLGDGLKEPIQIAFQDQFGTDEAGIDGGGVTKEFLISVTTEAFTPTGGPNLFIENDQHLLYPNPAAVDQLKDNLHQVDYSEGSPEWNEAIRDLLHQYEFLGRVVGKCLYEGILIDIHFAPFFLVKWALTGGSGSATNESSYRASINDLRDLDEALYQGLLQLKNYPGNVEDFSLDFTIVDDISTPEHNMSRNWQRNQRTITRELRKNGAQIPVTNENRLVYISYVSRHRLQIQPHLQTSAFLRGLGSMIEPSWLSMFNQSELQTLIGGDSSEIDVSDLRRNTQYGGVYVIGDDDEEHPTVEMFWEVMQTFSDADRRKVLKYVTSTPRAPLLGFGQLNPRFSIRDSGSDQTRLPSSSTCVNLLKLPIYNDTTTLRAKLQYAINAGAGFNLS